MNNETSIIKLNNNFKNKLTLKNLKFKITITNNDNISRFIKLILIILSAISILTKL